MNTIFETALNEWESIKTSSLEFGRLARLAIETEDKSIRDFSVALCGNSSLEDKIGRYIMAAEFAYSLNPQQYENVRDWLTTSHFTELRKIEKIYDRATALEYMQDIITEKPDGSVDVKPVEWLRAKRDNEEATTATLKHRFWKRAAKLLTEMLGELERKGHEATRRDRRVVRLLRWVVQEFQSEPEVA